MIERIATLSAIALLAACNPAIRTAETQPGDAARGEMIALDKCSGCHKVSDRQSKMETLWYPSFTNLANRPDTDYHLIASKLRMSHRYMPDRHLKEQDISDVATYIMDRGSRDISP
jgi:mono/diheme cytochrome c family protein